jgi:zinc transport system ATP-binding protein
MAEQSVVRVENVSVRYDRNPVVDQVSIEVARGSVFALLGRNGAGKSSLMRCLLGLQKPTSGRVLLFGEDVWLHRARLVARAAYVPENSDAP